MEFMTVLWLPIVVSAFVLFCASFVAWTMLPHHQGDFNKLPDEDRIMESVRNAELPAGAYIFPYLRHADYKDPAMQERYAKGPRGKLVVWDMPNMGRNLGLTFVYFLIVSWVTAYIAWSAIGLADFRKALQITGAIGVLVYASSGMLNAVWFPRRVITDFVDGVVYGVISGLIFAFFWPEP